VGAASAYQACGLFATGLVAGGLNAVAGGGGFLTLPALLVCGLPPVVANATSSLALWPGSLAEPYADRRELRSAAHPFMLFAAIGVAGGLAGGLLLLASRNDVVMALLPSLLLPATALGAQPRPHPRPPPGARHRDLHDGARPGPRLVAGLAGDAPAWPGRAGPG
jgi:uncharacterized membrane protein YfcA